MYSFFKKEHIQRNNPFVIRICESERAKWVSVLGRRKLHLSEKQAKIQTGILWIFSSKNKPQADAMCRLNCALRCKRMNTISTFYYITFCTYWSHNAMRCHAMRSIYSIALCSVRYSLGREKDIVLSLIQLQILFAFVMESCILGWPI